MLRSEAEDLVRKKAVYSVSGQRPVCQLILCSPKTEKFWRVLTHSQFEMFQLGSEEILFPDGNPEDCVGMGETLSLVLWD